MTRAPNQCHAKRQAEETQQVGGDVEVGDHVRVWFTPPGAIHATSSWEEGVVWRGRVVAFSLPAARHL